MTRRKKVEQQINLNPYDGALIAENKPLEETQETPKEGGGALAYYDIAPLVGNGYTRIWDDQSKVPYLKKNSGSGIISYDDTQSLGEKANYIKQKQLLTMVE